MKPLVSIIIPYYNHGKYLSSSVDSVLSSLYSNIEIILVNDSSTDEESILEFEKLNDYRIKKYTIPNGGPCTAKNFGVLQSSGQIIGFLDSDNEFIQDYISEAVNELNDMNLDWVYSDAEYFGDSYGLRSQKIKGKEELFINSPVDNCFFLRKTTFTKIGGFDENLNRLGLEDWEFVLRLVIGDYSYAHIEKPLFKYRVSKDSRSNLEAKHNRKKIIKYVFDKHHDTLFKYYSDMFFSNRLLENRKEIKIGKKVRRLFGRF